MPGCGATKSLALDREPADPPGQGVRLARATAGIRGNV